MKSCTKCHQKKDLMEFYKNKPSRDGHLNKCKTCCKKYCQTEKDRANHKRFDQSEKGKARNKRFNICHPNRKKATHAVSNAIRAGRLPRPDSLLCHYCPVQAQEYHHWHGYEPEHWLDVIPVCIECHYKYKRKIA